MNATSNAGSARGPATWPELHYADWKQTAATLHMWTQIVGKIRLAMAPAVNHYWHVPLYVTACGLTTSAIPYGDSNFEIEFDFQRHKLVIRTSTGATQELPLTPQSVADFYAAFMAALGSLSIHIKIWPMPVEIPNPIRFDQDRTHASYDGDSVQRFFQALSSVDRVLKEFRGRFIGKCSPVHFFWGSFDLAVTRFSGRRAPERPGADAVTREAYSHEVISAGFWPGNDQCDAMIYTYAAPEPPGFSTAPLKPTQAFYSREFSEFFLKYEDLRKELDPRAALLQFVESAYAAGAALGNWDRASLERAPA